MTINQALLKAVEAYKSGDVAAAKRLLSKIIQIEPNQPDANSNMGAILAAGGDLEEALPYFQTALEADFSVAQHWFNYIEALFKLGRFTEASELMATARNKGCKGQAFDVLQEKLNSPAAILKHKLNGLRDVIGRGSAEEALLIATKLLEKWPRSVSILDVMASAHKKLGNLDAYVDIYNRILKLKPDDDAAYNNMGIVLAEQNKPEEAVKAFSKALSINSSNAETYNNLGNALQKQGQFEEAVEAYKKSLSINPDNAEAYINMGAVLKDQGKLEEAIEVYKKAIAINNFNEDALLNSYHIAALMNDWFYTSSIRHRLEITQHTGTVSVYGLLAFSDSPAMHLEKAKATATKKYSCKPKCKIKPFQKSKRIKLGYFSSYFRQHPVSILSAQMLELHNKEQFETFAFHYGPDNNDKYNLRIQESFCNFINVSNLSDKEIAELACENRIDIAIEFNGYMADGRMGILAHRPAPIQINYLAYPGTMGADFYDYIIGDQVVIPKVQKNNYSEKIIYLPNCYMPQDNTRQISDKSILRAECGLPVTGFVFCCFNNSFKIGPNEFDIWMRLLKSVEYSVIWLMKTNKLAEDNLRNEAKKRGVKPNRLVFADRLPLNEHLRRIKNADLFLDTFNFNAHTTASDALWAGLPVVTKIGKGFAARVAGSLLSSIELPELITTTEQDYEALALSLATNPVKLAKIKKKLDHNRHSAPLFDTETYTKNLEKAYTHAYQRYTNGLPPAEFEIP